MAYLFNLLVMMTVALCLYILFYKHSDVVVGNIGKKHFSKKILPSQMVAFSVLLTIILVFFCFRYIGVIDGVNYGGIDAIVYRNRFLNATGGLIEGINSQSNEPLYGLLVYSVRLFTDNFTVFLVVYYAITLALIFRVLSKININNPYYIIVIFVAICMPLHESMNLMRNCLAYFITLNSFIAIQNKKYLQSIVILLLAIGCQVSASLFAVYLFMKIINDKTKITAFTNAIIIFGLSICAIVGLSILSVILENTKYIVYLDKGAIPKIVSLQRLMMIAVSLVVGLKSLNKSNDVNTLYLLAITSLIVIVLQASVSILNRSNVYFNVMYLVLPSLIYNNKELAWDNIVIKFGNQMLLLPTYTVDKNCVIAYKNTINKNTIIKVSILLLGMSVIIQILRMYSSYGILNWAFGF